MKSSGIGGQAVLEGVMMRNKDRYAVAVRKPDGSLALEQGECKSIKERYKILGIPFVRGVVNFIESLVLGTKMMTSSAAYFEEEEKPGKFELWLKKVFGDKADKVIMGFATMLGIVLALVLFAFLPLFLVSLIPEERLAYEWRAVLEGGIRLVIFIVYLALVACNKDIKRVFMYHGAEHKAINCIEHGMPLNVKNVRKSSKQHKRCGTSFLLFVIIFSIIFFIFFRVETFWLRLLIRLLFVPVLAGISYEFIRLAGSTDNKFVNILAKPGLWLQRLTTREPNDEMIKVAIAAVEAVFDWKAYLDENFNKKKSDDKLKKAADRRQEKRAEREKTEETKKVEIGNSADKSEKTKIEGKKPEETKAEVKKPEETKAEAKKPEETKAEEKKPEETKAEEKKTETAPKAASVFPEDSLEAKFDRHFVADAPKPEEEISPEKAAQESRKNLVAKVSAADRAEEARKRAMAAREFPEEDEEEEDEVLRALDQYFVFDGEKTVMERSDNK